MMLLLFWYLKYVVWWGFSTESSLLIALLTWFDILFYRFCANEPVSIRHLCLPLNCIRHFLSPQNLLGDVDCWSEIVLSVPLSHLLKMISFYLNSFSDRTLKVWNMDSVSDNNEEVLTLKAKAVVAAHDKDINCLAVAPNDSLVCSGSQVCNIETSA